MLTLKIAVVALMGVNLIMLIKILALAYVAGEKEKQLKAYDRQVGWHGLHDGEQ